MLIGNKNCFGIEFDLDSSARADELYGTLWIWAGGELIGNTDATELIVIGLDSLQELTSENLSDGSSILSGYTPEQALGAVMWCRYGNNDSAPIPLTHKEIDTLIGVEIFPRRTGPFFEGWEGILLIDDRAERLIYRKEGEATNIALLPLGTYSKTVRTARSAFNMLSTRDHGPLQ